MDEGVDPTHLSRGLMDKVARSKQLMAVADPEVLVLFEDWLEEMETEVEMHAKKTGSVNPDDIANGLGLSRSGARFLIAKLRREGKL